MNDLKIEYVDISTLKPCPENAKIHTTQQIEQIKKSILKFGMNDPIAVWKDNLIIEGHGRLTACKELEIKQVPIIRLDSLTDQQRKAYALIHNQLTNNTEFDLELLHSKLEQITDIDMQFFGFDAGLEEKLDDFFQEGVQAKSKENQEEQDQDFESELMQVTVFVPPELADYFKELMQNYNFDYEEQ